MKNFEDLKAAIIHDQLTQYGGAERTLEQILDIFPNADIITGYLKPINISQKILEHRIIAGPTFLRYMSFLMPFVFENFDLRKYDVIISEGTAWPKGVITSPEQLHVSYIYTPPRFLYGYATEGQKRDVWYLKPFLQIIDHFLRIWDYSAAQRPDFILTISKEVAGRVKKFYGRDSHTVYPPVESASGSKTTNNSGDYYFCIGRLAAYKNIDLLIQAIKETNLKVKIAGTGREESKLKAMAVKHAEVLTTPRIDAQPKAYTGHDIEIVTQNIEILGFVSGEKKKDLFENCKGFIFPTDHEDFGIVVVEALSYGKPVLCHRSGGPLEIISEGENGMFFSKLDSKELAEKIIEFDKNIDSGKYDPRKAIESSKKFDSERFKKEFKVYIKQKWEEKENGRAT